MVPVLLCIFKENEYIEDNMTNVIKFQSPFERTKDYNNRNPEIALLKAIILQAIIDATNISTSNEARKDEVNAKAWLYGGTEEFNNVCALVDYEPGYVRKIARNIERLHKQNSTTTNYNSNSSVLTKAKRRKSTTASMMNNDFKLHPITVEGNN